MITFSRAEKVARLLKPQVPSLRGVSTAEHLEDLSRRPGSATSARRVRGEDIAFLQYTSGSTGDPKGVTLTHANLLANIRVIAEGFDFGPHDQAISWLPLYHDMGLIGAWLTPLYVGAPLTIMSPLAFLSRPERWLWAIHQQRGSVTAAPNFAYELCVRKVSDEQIEGLDLSSMRLMLNGAEPVNPVTVERFCERYARYGFPRGALMPVYGLAENSLAVTYTPPGRGPLVDRIERATFEREGRAVPLAASPAPETPQPAETESAELSSKDVCGFAALPPHPATTATPRPPRRSSKATAGSIPATAHTWPEARSTSPDAPRTSSSKPDATSTLTRSKSWPGALPESARAAWWPSAFPTRTPARKN